MRLPLALAALLERVVSRLSLALAATVLPLLLAATVLDVLRRPLPGALGRVGTLPP